MIDKDKTIKKAVSKYNSIFPVRGKKSIDDCFFCLRGEYFFTFRTKDKKVHTMKALLSRQVSAGVSINREALDSIFRVLNKPIIVRSLIIKKPVGTWLINLFPVPGISWSTNVTHQSRTGGAPQSDRNDDMYLVEKSDVDWTTVLNETSEYTRTPPHPMRDMRRSEPDRFYNQGYQPQYDTGTCQYDILATGYLPVSPPVDWMN